MLNTQFQHSQRVARLYKVASLIAKDYSEEKGSLKQLVYDAKHPRIKSIYSLVSTLFQRAEVLDRLLKKSNFLAKEHRCEPWLAKILIVELLWGKGLKGQSKPENTVRAYEQIFKAHLSDEKQVWNNNRNFEAPSKPRYVRINTLKITLKEVIAGFQNEGWQLLDVEDKLSYVGFLEKVSALNEGTFLVDIHIPDLLIFPTKTELYNHYALRMGYIFLQDKASCLPVHILNPPPGSVVLDMCAAPGMKTTQLAAYLNNSGTVFAVDQDPRRFKILNDIVNSAGATCVKTVNQDVLTCYNGEFSEVEYILVDPSCSGSGMTDRRDFQEKINVQRLEKLAGFQIKILRNALTRYRKAQRVVYSTCSVYTEENEDVVRQVLETNYNFKLVPAKQFLNNEWVNVGSPDFGEIGEFCLYAKPNKDYTNGFFIAVFERLKEGEENQFFNDKIFNFKKDARMNEIKKQKRERKKETDNKLRQKKNKGQSKYIENINSVNEGNDNNNADKVSSKEKKKVKKTKDTLNNIGTNVNYFQEGENSVEEPIKKKTKHKKMNSNTTKEGKSFNNIATGINRVQEVENVETIRKKKKHKKTDEEINKPFKSHGTDISQYQGAEESVEKSTKNKKPKLTVQVVTNNETYNNTETDVSYNNKVENSSEKQMKKKKHKKNYVRVPEHTETFNDIEPGYFEMFDKKSTNKEKQKINNVDQIGNEIFSSFKMGANYVAETEHSDEQPMKKKKHKKNDIVLQQHDETICIVDSCEDNEFRKRKQKKDIINDQFVRDIDESDRNIKSIEEKNAMKNRQSTSSVVKAKSKKKKHGKLENALEDMVSVNLDSSEDVIFVNVENLPESEIKYKHKKKNGKYIIDKRESENSQDCRMKRIKRKRKKGEVPEDSDARNADEVINIEYVNLVDNNEESDLKIKQKKQRSKLIESPKSKTKLKQIKASDLKTVENELDSEK